MSGWPTPGDGGGIERFDPSDTATRAEIDGLLRRAGDATGHPALSEASQLAWLGVDGDFLGLLRRSAGRVSAYAHLGRRASSWSVEVVTDPAVADAEAARPVLLRSAVAAARAGHAAELRYWRTQHHDDTDEASALGFVLDRDLLQMRVPLPLKIERSSIDPTLALRPFEPGKDEAPWLEQNNRAFAAHPEQGHWEMGALVARERADWFDPDGFLLCWSDTTLAASCWTKVHRAEGLGEIYVISVDPAFQGRGLGRTLTVAGLDWLSRRVMVGMLYVDASNTAAVGLYQSLGFTVDHVDRAWVLALDPGG